MPETNIKDTDYLFLAARVRTMERDLLSQSRMDRMLEAPSAEEAAKVLTECGYPELSQVDVNTVNAALAQVRDTVLADLAALAPDPRIVDVFRIQYDYHNVKVLLKSAALGLDAQRLLVNAGRVDAQELAECIRSGDTRGLPARLQDAAAEARDVLGATRDPQLSDCVLDRAYFEELFQLAADSGSEFLAGYVRLLVDVANLKSAVRAQRLGLGPEFLTGILFPGGDIPLQRLTECVNTGAPLADLYAASDLHEAAQAGAEAISGGSLTAFERLCDNAVGRYLATARYTAFGEAPLIAYLAAREREQTAIRIILSGLLAGLPRDQIRERLRDSYV